MRTEPLRKLVQFAADLRYEHLPDSIRRQSKLAFLHNLVVALAARPERIAGQDSTRWPSGLAPESAATRLTDGCCAPTESAIFTNSLAMGARAQHDEHPGSISHLGSTVLPPLLAASEQRGARGTDILAAMTAGYEVAARIGALSVSRTTSRGFRPTSLYGPIGGAVAVVKVLKLDEHMLSNAISIASNTSCGFTQTWIDGTDEWRYQTAFAARNGYAAATLARLGVRGTYGTFNGTNGFHRAFAGDSLSLEPLALQLHDNWALNDVLLKPYPICALNQAPIQQLLTMVSERDLAPDDVRQLVVRMNPGDCKYAGVDTTGLLHTRSAALMSLQTCASIALIHRDISLEHLDRPSSPEIRAVVERVSLQPDPSVESHFSTVELELRSGEKITSGPPRGVVYDERVSNEVLQRLQPLTGLDPQRLAELRNVIVHLEELDNLADLMKCCRP